MAELESPVAVQGTFIHAGNVFDAMVALGKVLKSATKDVLIVDPYMDEKALSDFALKGAICLLSDEHSVNASSSIRTMGETIRCHAAINCEARASTHVA